MMHKRYTFLPLTLATALSALSATALTPGVSTTYAKGSSDQPTDSINHNSLRKDSVPADTTVHELLGVEVEGSYVTYRPGEASYTPTRKQKNASADAIALLRRMYIPQLSVSPAGVTSASGLPVRYFINGHPAADEDLTSMNMRDVRKVVCLDHPDDAKYLGADFVVDFIVQEYEYGGYSKLYGGATFLSSNSFAEQLSSKWTYRRMTYDLCLSPSQIHRRMDGERSEETYRLPQGEVRRELYPESFSKTSNGLPVQFRAVYSHGSTYVSNRLGYAFTESGRNNVGGRETFYVKDGSRTVDFETWQPDRSNTVNLDGFISATPGKGWNISTEYSLYYSHYNNRYSHVTTLPLVIDRTTRQDAFKAEASVKATRNLAGRQKIYTVISGDVYRSKARYSGDMNTVSTFSWPSISARVGYSVKTGATSTDVYAGVAYEHSDIDGRSVDTTYPFGMVRFSYTPNWHHSLSAWAQYSTFSPLLSEKNPNITRESELMYYAGNPELTPYPAITAGMRYFWSITNKAFIGINGSLAHLLDRFSRVYSLTDDGDAVLRGFAQTGDCTRLSITPTATFAFFNRSLWINLQPSLSIYDPGKNSLMKRIVKLHGYASADLLLGQFNIGVNYWTPNARFSNDRMDAKVRTRHYYYLEGGWGNSIVNVTLTLYNIFSKSWDGDVTTIASPVYDARVTDLGSRYRQNFKLTLTYTVSYGKKIANRDNLDGNVSGAGSVIEK